MDGIKSGKSAYENYSWKPELTIPMAKRLIEVMGIKEDDQFLDFGCARGYVSKALYQLGIKHPWGCDISLWARENADPEIRHWIIRNPQHVYYDHVLAKDVFEHLYPDELADTLPLLLKLVRKSMLIIVPLTQVFGGKYLRKEDNLDVTHVIRWPLQDWMSFIQGCVNGEEFTLSGSWHISGLKPTSLNYMKSCGFILLRKNTCKS